MNRLYIDFHVIQTVPPSCVNRDDTGSPKTAIYGGARRARVSSQAWKRAMREVFRDNLKESELGVRTKRIIELVAKKIVELDSSKAEEAKPLAEKIINLAGITTKDGEAKALFFIGTQQAKNLAELALSDEPNKKQAQAALLKDHAIEIALFGRMVADEPSLNTDATAQVAHCISTHVVTNEYDYFTAADDMKSHEEDAGAGMIGTVEFNSSTLYRYATVAAHELYNQLSEDSQALSRAIAEFARAFIISMPTGKQNTFANRTLPDAVMVAVRTDQPINLAGAFEMPVKASSDGGYRDTSIKALCQYAREVYDSFAQPPCKAYVIGTGLGDMGIGVKMDTLFSSLAEDIRSEFSENREA